MRSSKVRRSSCGSLENVGFSNHRLRVAPSTIPGGGLGVFADDDFAKGEVLTQYIGELLDRKQAMELRRQGKATHMATLNQHQIIDAQHEIDHKADWKQKTKGFPVGGFTNAPLSPEGTNSQFCVQEKQPRAWSENIFALRNQKGELKEKPSETLWIRSIRPIKRGEEIFVPYGRSYWKNKRKRETTGDTGKSTAETTSSLRRGGTPTRGSFGDSSLEYMGLVDNQKIHKFFE